MNFSIAEIIRRLWSPRHELSCSWFLWRRLLAALRERGLHGRRESGAFLLGRRRDGRARITEFVLYDDLDPHCLDTGIVRFDGSYFGDLWRICKERDLKVVADVHTHPTGSQQSDSDRDHPMITSAGHIAPHCAVLCRPASTTGRRRDVPLPGSQAVGNGAREPTPSILSNCSIGL